MIEMLVVPPERRTILGMNMDCYNDGGDFYFDEDTRRTERFFLPFPYTIFIYKKKGGKPLLFVGFANEEPNEKTTVYFPPIPNIYQGWYVCLAYAWRDNYYLENLATTLDYFWQSQFDLRQVPSSSVSVASMPGPYMVEQMGSYKEWEKLSLEEALRVEWQTNPDYRMTFAKFKSYAVSYQR